MAIVLAPTSQLSHYAHAFDDLSAMGRVADRLKRHRDEKLVWGPFRHGPGDNHFMYLHDYDGAVIELCSKLAPCMESAARSSRRCTRDERR